jgi:hypothetical protein
VSTFNKVFGIGLSKTGTTSLGLALKRLGIKTIDYPHDPTTLRELEQGNFRLSVLEQYQAVTDTPVAIYYAQLDKLFPGSRFILTVREKDSWLRSVEEHWKFSEEWAQRHLPFRRFTYFIHAAVYGTYAFERERFSFVYDQHVHNVIEYFRDRPEDLLVLDVCRGDGYGKLCRFLGFPVVDEPFPRANTKHEKIVRREWIRRVDEVTAGISALVEKEATILLLDEGQLAGTPVSHQRETVPFPEHNGEYAGRPATAKDAVNQMQSIQQRHSLDYLVVAWPAFWWLEHYDDLAAHLDRLPRVHADENFILFDLRSNPSASRKRD